MTRNWENQAGNLTGMIRYYNKIKNGEVCDGSNLL